MPWVIFYVFLIICLKKKITKIIVDIVFKKVILN